MPNERLNRIILHETYRTCLRKTAEYEKDRLFCKHDMSHFLDVARIGMLLNIQESYGIEPELVYAAALLHDIGRWKQYETGADHAQESAKLAPPILEACAFTREEQECILSAIATHRDASVRDQKNLNGLLYRADKSSRPCFFCEQEKACNWKEGKKNLSLCI